MSVGVQGRAPESAGARGLMGARFRYDVKVREAEHQNMANAVSSLEDKLKTTNDLSYEAIDGMMKHICGLQHVHPEDLHHAFIKTHNMSPDTYAKRWHRSRLGKPARI